MQGRVIEKKKDRQGMAAGGKAGRERKGAISKACRRFLTKSCNC